MKILVLDGNQNQAVACVRSLARRRHTVWAGESRAWSKASWSRYCSASFQYAPPEKDAHQFLADVLGEARKEAGTLVLPMTEATTSLISSHRDLFTQVGARLVLPGHADLLRAFDKRHTTELAQSLGIAVPKTVLVSDAGELDEACSSLQFPVVLKPRASQEHSRDGSTRATGRPAYAENKTEAIAAFTQMRYLCSFVLVQEFVEGTGAGATSRVCPSPDSRFTSDRLGQCFARKRFAKCIDSRRQPRDVAGAELARCGDDRVPRSPRQRSRFSRNQRTILALFAAGLLRGSRLPCTSGHHGRVRVRKLAATLQGRRSVPLAGWGFSSSHGGVEGPSARFPGQVPPSIVYSSRRAHPDPGNVP
jgi:hypothetical protein